MTNSLQTRHSSEAPRSRATSSWSSDRWKEETFTRESSQLPEDPHDPSDDLDVLGVDRLERGVLRLQADAVRLTVDCLHGRLVGRLVVACECDDALAVPRVLCVLH